ncbi:MAG: hypothetical protein ACREJC_05520 [Tepidisphaeraceae bacterium]
MFGLLNFKQTIRLILGDLEQEVIKAERTGDAQTAKVLRIIFGIVHTRLLKD